MLTGQWRAVGITPRGSVTHLDFLHGIDRLLGQGQMQPHPVAVADGLRFAVATHQPCFRWLGWLRVCSSTRCAIASPVTSKVAVSQSSRRKARKSSA